MKKQILLTSSIYITLTAGILCPVFENLGLDTLFIVSFLIAFFGCVVSGLLFRMLLSVEF